VVNVAHKMVRTLGLFLMIFLRYVGCFSRQRGLAGILLLLFSELHPDIGEPTVGDAVGNFSAAEEIASSSFVGVEVDTRFAAGQLVRGSRGSSKNSIYDVDWRC